METLNTMDEMSYLIHLEAYRRFKNEELHLRRIVEEKFKHYIEIKIEYLNAYAKYVEMLKLCAVREVLETGQNLDSNTEQATRSMETIARKTSIDQQVEFLQTQILRLAKETLAKTHNFQHLTELHYITANNKNRIDFIESSLARLNSKLKTSITSGFDSFLNRIGE